MRNDGVLASFLKSVRSGLWVIAAISLCSSLLMLVLPIYSLQLFDRVLLSRSIDTYWLLTLIVFVAMVAVAVLEWLRAQLLIRISNRLAIRLEEPLFKFILFRSAMVADRTLQPLRDLSVLRNFVSSAQGLPPLIDAPLVPVFLVVVLLIHPSLGTVMCIGIILLFTMAWIGDRGSAKLSQQAFAQAQVAQRRLEDLVQGAAVLKAHGRTRPAHEFWQDIEHGSLALASRANDRVAHLSSAAKAVRLLLTVSMTAVGGYLAMTDQITAGAMIAATILGSRGLAPVETLIVSSRYLVAARMSWRRLKAVLDVEPLPTTTRLPPPRGDLEVDKVIYAPPGSERTTLKGISFKLQAGTFLGLVGPSAAGKTTLARLICGLGRPQAGTVRLDGASVEIWDHEDFGNACGYLPQDVQLHDATVRENISRFRPCTDEDVVNAAIAAGAHDFITRLDKGYETRVGPSGSMLSAGQRQRIGLARAFFGDPRLVVLDEPDANLDGDGERALAQGLARLKARGATVIVISHRAALLDIADMIAVLVDGQLQRFGPRTEIAKRMQPQGLPTSRDVA